MSNAAAQTLEINFDSLEQASKKAKKVTDEIDDYIDEINAKVINQINNAEGSDTMLYAASAINVATNKINALTAHKEQFTSLKASIDTFSTSARDADKKVGTEIASVADATIKKKGFFSNIGNSIYNFFCIDVANKTALGRAISNVFRWGANKIDEIGGKVIDWFKSGQGQYVLKMVGAIAGAVAATIAAGTAIASLIITAGASSPVALAVLCKSLAALGATGVAVMTAINAEKQIEGAGKAMVKYHQGDIGGARYYGNISGVSEYYKRTDMGGEAENEHYKKVGEHFDNTKKMFEIIGAVGTIGSLGIKQDYRFTVVEERGIKGYDLSYDNIKKNIMHEAGYRYTKEKIKLPDGTVKTQTVKKLSFDKLFDIGKGIENYAKNPGKFHKNVEKITDYFENPSWEGNKEAVSGALGIFGNFSSYGKAWSKFSGAVDKIISNGTDIGIYATS